MYKVLDTCGGTLREFPTFEKANNFRLTANRHYSRQSRRN